MNKLTDINDIYMWIGDHWYQLVEEKKEEEAIIKWMKLTNSELDYDTAHLMFSCAGKSFEETRKII